MLKPYLFFRNQQNKKCTVVKLHKRFDEQRLNLVNSRKEFFNVNLESIEEEVQQQFPEAEFVVTAEAREYRESEAIRKQRESKQEYVDSELPLSI